MDWTSRRVTAILENALQEDRATSDATTYACIDVNQRASATILAKQDCVLAGLGCIPARARRFRHAGRNGHLASRCHVQLRSF